MTANTIFVTATGTDVGKTFVSARLLAFLRARGKRVSALKPVLSGFDENNPEAWAASDPGVLLRAMARPIDLDSISALSPWRFFAPLSPDMAAEREQRAVVFSTVVAHSSAPHGDDVRLIEGVGGVLVPLDDSHTVADWCAEVGAPTLLVTRGALGTLSHTLAAVECLRARGVHIAAVALNHGVDEFDALAPSVDETVRSLSRHIRAAGETIPIVPIARDAPEADMNALAQVFGLL